MPEQKRIVIVGAGLGGICAAIQLKERGIDDFVIFERSEAVGGVWHENRYPGCACDVPISLYQFSFAPSLNWSHIYPRSPEIQAYVEEITDRFDLRPHLRLNEGVESADWDEGAKTWKIRSEAGTQIDAEVLIAALGQLNRPAYPDIPGLDSFAGPTMHSARWDESVDLTGKRVCVVGSAASAVQLIPEVAKQASHLTVFQRTPNWIVPRNDVEITDEDKALMMTAPELALKNSQYNRELWWENSDYLFWQVFEWTELGRNAYQRRALNHLHAQVEDPELRAQLTPDYPIGCKRILFCDDFYPTLTRDDVSLVTDGIASIESDGIVTADGEKHACDVIVFATGFETTGWKWSMEVRGRSGTALNDAWSDGPEAYLGITVADYPNLFVLYGPNTNLGHNSIIYMLEQQVGYTMRALEALDAKKAKVMAVTDEAQKRFNAELQEGLSKTVWADPQCASWYKNADGRITQNWSSHTRGYKEATSSVNLDDYEFSS